MSNNLWSHVILWHLPSHIFLLQLCYFTVLSKLFQRSVFIRFVRSWVFLAWLFFSFFFFLFLLEIWLAASAVLWLLLIIGRLHACCLLCVGSSAFELDFLAFVLDVSVPFTLAVDFKWTLTNSPQTLTSALKKCKFYKEMLYNLH